MNTVTKYARLVGVGIAFSIALPVCAEEASTASNKIYPSAKPMVAKGKGPSRSIDSSQQIEDSTDTTATTTKKAEVPDPSDTPYMTYEGATSSNTDR